MSEEIMTGKTFGPYETVEIKTIVIKGIRDDEDRRRVLSYHIRNDTLIVEFNVDDKIDALIGVKRLLKVLSSHRSLWQRLIGENPSPLVVGRQVVLPTQELVSAIPYIKDNWKILFER